MVSGQWTQHNQIEPTSKDHTSDSLIYASNGSNMVK